MSNTIKNFISLVLQESLKKDVERHELARQIYAHTLRGLRDLRKMKMSGGLYYENPEGGGQSGEMAPVGAYLDAHSAEVYVKIKDLPGDLPAALVLPNSPLNFIVFSMKIRTPEDKASTSASGLYHHATSQAAVITVYGEASELDLRAIAEDEKEISEKLSGFFARNKSIIIHETAHMLDDLSLIGTEKFRREGIYNIDPETGISKSDKRYYDAAPEVNARWVEVISEIDPLQYSDYDPEDEWKFYAWLFNAKQTIGFSKMSPAKQRKFINRFWDFYKGGPYPMPANRIEDVAQQVFKDFKDYTKRLLSPYEHPPSEYSSRTMEYLGTWQGYVENSMEGYKWDRLMIQEPDSFRREYYTTENTKKIMDRAEALAKPVEEEFKREFAKVAYKYEDTV